MAAVIVGRDFLGSTGLLHVAGGNIFKQMWSICRLSNSQTCGYVYDLDRCMLEELLIVVHPIVLSTYLW